MIQQACFATGKMTPQSADRAKWDGNKVNNGMPRLLLFMPINGHLAQLNSVLLVIFIEEYLFYDWQHELSHFK